MADVRTWKLVTQSDGIALLPPGGVAEGAIRIRDLQRPLRSAADIFARANTPALAQGVIESLITSEGEYAAFQVQRGSIEGRSVTRFVGAVFGDDAYTLVVALAAEHASMVEDAARTCVMRCALGLGHRRQRRYRYAAPEEWAEVPWGLATRWYATDGSELVVHPAMPSTTPVEVLLDAIRARNGIEMAECAAPRCACFARMWRGSDLHVVILDDGRFRYVIELRGADVHSEVLARVVGSVRLVPPAESPPLTDALLHWAE